MCGKSLLLHLQFVCLCVCVHVVSCVPVYLAVCVARDKRQQQLASQKKRRNSFIVARN